jgi:phage terminase large subunit-like protein
VISIPRQVGKTFLIGAIVFALCLLHPGLTVVWTAHRSRTAGETFGSMQAFAKRRKIKPHVSKIVLGAGDEAVQFYNGSRILFGARERGFGRGFADVDVLVFDEGQILTENAIDDMVPSTNTAANPLVLFMGTPPKEKDPSEVFTRKRAEALSGEDTDTVFIEFSADPEADPDDRKQWAKANPSYPRRTPAAAIQRMKKNLTLPSFLREGLGIWDEVELDQVIPAEHWKITLDAASTLVGDVALAVEVSEDRAWSAIGAAGRSSIEDPPGMVHGELVAYDAGTDWIVADLVKRCPKAGTKQVVVAKGSPAASLAAAIKKAGLEVVEVTTDEQARFCGDLYDAVIEHRFRHRDQAALSVAVRGAVKRDVGDGAWCWSRRRSSVDISPLSAVTNAAGHFGLRPPTPEVYSAPTQDQAPDEFWRPNERLSI